MKNFTSSGMLYVSCRGVFKDTDGVQGLDCDDREY